MPKCNMFQIMKNATKSALARFMYISYNFNDGQSMLNIHIIAAPFGFVSGPRCLLAIYSFETIYTVISDTCCILYTVRDICTKSSIFQ